MKNYFVSILFLSFLGYGQENMLTWKRDLFSIKYGNDTTSINFMNTQNVISQNWNTLAQPIFWKKIMLLSPDSCLINVGSTRKIIQQLTVKQWNSWSDEVKNHYRDSVRTVNELDTDEHIFMTSGKKDFYQFDKVIPTIPQGIIAFENEGVDPWYAQAILMIESPGSLNKSTVGAYGPFQLMRAVAVRFGLKVNKYEDERKDFNKSAQAASHLIQTICIPEAKRILDEASIKYTPTDLWFRLFVLHVYHAGAGNVQKVIQAIAPNEGGQSLITKMWQTKAGNFGNSSQNYSQLALASLMVLNEELIKLKKH